jgi:hypothetical protein
LLSLEMFISTFCTNILPHVQWCAVLTESPDKACLVYIHFILIINWKNMCVICFFARILEINLTLSLFTFSFSFQLIFHSWSSGLVCWQCPSFTFTVAFRIPTTTQHLLVSFA